MAAPVFYSVSMFGTADIKNGSPNITIDSNGVGSLTVAQTGNMGVGTEIEYNSLHAHIAPNRIGFDAGSTEIKVDYKITDATSGATGIIRFVEITGGTWAGNDAAGWLYFEKTTGTFGNNNVINITKPTSTASAAVVNGTIQGNIGGDNDEFVLKTVTGGTPPVQTSTAVTSIHHVWATLAAFEGAFTGASYINNTDLTAADVVAHCCMYYDHVGSPGDADSTTVTINWTGTTDATRHLVIFCPAGNAESINVQGHIGVYTTAKARLEISLADFGEIFQIEETYCEFNGIQIEVSGSNQYEAGFTVAANYQTWKNVIISDVGSGVNHRGIQKGSTTDHTLNNIIIYGSDQYALFGDQLNGGVKLNYVTFYGCGGGTRQAWKEFLVKNCLVYNNTEDFTNDGNATYADGSDYNFSKDDTAPGGNSIHGDTDVKTPDFVNTGSGTEDFNLQSTSDAIGVGVDLTSSEGIWRDIAGNERGATPDIGAFEYVVLGPIGWTGIMDGVTDPGKIDSILAVNIKSINGIE
jgi:hypothetical protein